MAADESALVQRCLAGHPEAMRQLIERFHPDVFGLSFRMLNHRQDAEDVAQEVFLRIFRSLRRWDATRPLKPWVMSIAVNRCRTWISQRVRRPELVDYLQDIVGKEDRDDSTELVAEIQAAILELRPDYRAVFIMFHEQGSAYEIIADALGRPVGTIKTWLHRARLEVFERLKRRGMVPEEEPLLSVGIKPSTE